MSAKLICTLGTLGFAVSAADAAAPQPPNVILILADDQSFETMKCWGGDVYTPNIDRLADEGMKFTRAYVASSISAASRYSILSGRYPGRCTAEQFSERFPDGVPYVIDNTVMALEKDRTNLPALLRAHGYFTGMVGKWHLGYHFDDNLPHKRKESWEKNGLRYYDPQSDPRDADVASALAHNHAWYAAKIRECGFDYADNIYWANLREVFNDKLNHHNIDWTVRGALDFMRQSGERPFFLYFSTTLHHGPTPQRSVPSEYETVTSKGFADAKMNVMPDRKSLYDRCSAQGIRAGREYALWLDDAVGALIAELENQDKADNTLVIYMSDHGITGKASLYEGGVRTPMIGWWKGRVVGGAECERLVHSCDLAPTILEAAGIETQSEGAFDGKSMIGLFDNPQKVFRESVYSEIGNARSVVCERYKYIAVDWDAAAQGKIARGETEKVGYIRNMGLCAIGKKNPNYFSEDQLYDLSADPAETNNLADDPQYAEVLTQMKSELTRYVVSFSGRPFREFTSGKQRESSGNLNTN